MNYLNGCNSQFSIAWGHQIILITHENTSFRTGLLSLWKMKIHLIAIEIGIVRCANKSIETEGAVGQNFGLVTHDGKFMQ